MVDDRANPKNIYADTIESPSENNQKEQFLREAEEALREFDKYFVQEKLSCEKMLGNTFTCRELDLFELYICVVAKELRNIRKIRSVVWNKIEISGQKVVYPYIKAIWDVIEKEYGQKTCSKTTGCVFSRRVKRCGTEPKVETKGASAETDFIFYINGEEKRESRYGDLIALLCIYNKELYDIADEKFKKEDLEHIKQTVDIMLGDYYNKEMKSKVIKDIQTITMQRRKDFYEKSLCDEDNGLTAEKCLCDTMFWQRITISQKWWDDYEK